MYATDWIQERCIFLLSYTKFHPGCLDYHTFFFFGYMRCSFTFSVSFADESANYVFMAKAHTEIQFQY